MTLPNTIIFFTSTMMSLKTLPLIRFVGHKCAVELISICICIVKSPYGQLSRPQYLGRGCSLDNDCVLFYLCGHNVVIPRECIQIYTLSAIMCFWRIVYIHRYVWTRNVRCVFAQTKQWEHSINPQPAPRSPSTHTYYNVYPAHLIYPTINMFTLLSCLRSIPVSPKVVCQSVS